MQIGIIGINHKSATLPLREKLATACDRLFGQSRYLHPYFSFVLLSTCNRIEIYFSSQDLSETHIHILNALRRETEEEFEHCIYTYFGTDCFLHLARVTSGLDSAMLGETEIQGQVKRAYESASSDRMLLSALHFLFQKCLKIGKNIRSHSHFFEKALSIEEAILNAIQEKFTADLKKKILFVGLSQINYQLLLKLKKQDKHLITLCNRTDEKSKRVAAREDIFWLQWKELACWTDFDVTIFATKSPQFLAKPEHLKNSLSKKLLFDLSVPRNVDPRLSRHLITLLNIDQLNQTLDRKRRLKVQELANIEKKWITQAVAQQTSLFRRKELHHMPLLAQVS